jgi:hypothetical protein
MKGCCIPGSHSPAVLCNDIHPNHGDSTSFLTAHDASDRSLVAFQTVYCLHGRLHATSQVRMPAALYLE